MKRRGAHPFLPLHLALAALLFAAALAAQAPAALPYGAWTEDTANAEGRWRVLATDGGLELELDPLFRTKSAPDLKLYLSPRPVSELDAKNVTTGALLIAPLASAKGAQRYPPPTGTDLAKVQSLAIHCERYEKLWAKSSL